MLDASRVTDVVSALLDPERRAALDGENRELQERLRVQHAEKQKRPLLPLEEARANRVRLAFDDLPVPPFTGSRDGLADARRARAAHRLAVLLPRLGPEGQVPDDPRAAGRARALRRRAGGARPDRPRTVAAGTRRLRLLAGARGGRRRGRRGRRASASSASRRPTATAGRTVPRRLRSARRGSRRRVRRLDPRCRRARGIARARARRLPRDHRQGARRPARRGVRRVAPPARAPRVVRAGRAAASDELLRERFRGIRPAFGYPACPDHSEKTKLFDLLGADAGGSS